MTTTTTTTSATNTTPTPSPVPTPATIDDLPNNFDHLLKPPVKTVTAAATAAPARVVDDDEGDLELRYAAVEPALPPGVHPVTIATAADVARAMENQWQTGFIAAVTKITAVQGRAPPWNRCQLQCDLQLPEMVELRSGDWNLMRLCATTPVVDLRALMTTMCSAYSDQFKRHASLSDVPTRLGKLLPVFVRDAANSSDVVTPLINQAWHGALRAMRADVDRRLADGDRTVAGYRSLYLLDMRGVKLETLKKTDTEWKKNLVYPIRCHQKQRDGKGNQTVIDLIINDAARRPKRITKEDWPPYVARFRDTSRVDEKFTRPTLAGKSADETGRVALRSLCFVLVDDEARAIKSRAFMARAQCAFTQGTKYERKGQTSRASGFQVILAKSGMMLHLAPGIVEVAEDTRKEIGLFKVYDHKNSRCDPVAAADYCRFMWRSIATRDYARLLAAEIPTTVFRYTPEQAADHAGWITHYSTRNLMDYVLWPLYFAHLEEPLGS